MKDPWTSPSFAVRDGYPNPWVEVAIYTHLPDSGREGTKPSSRNHLNVLSATALVAFPGSDGTFSEMWLAIRYGVPVAAHGSHARVPSGVKRTASLEEAQLFLMESVRSRRYPPFHSFR
jgi:hypothetical protein